MADSSIPVLPPEEAIAFFRKKGLARSFAWQEMYGAQHDFFFTVAKMMSVSLLEDTHAELLAALEDGRSPKQLGRDLKTLLAKRGWWGKALQDDPLTGEKTLVQLGSNQRVRTIVNTNLRTAYSAGRYERQDRTKEAFPILVYKSRMDGRERPQHHAWHNTALLIGHLWWKTHYPPCDWGCRCRTVSMTLKMAERRGLKIGALPPDFGKRRWINKRTGEVMDIERGIGAGWDYHPGRAKLEGIAPDPLFGFSKGDGDAIADAAAPAADRFLALFDAGEAGAVWKDATGWPLPISRGWLQGLSAEGREMAVDASGAILSPDAIRLVWVTGKDRRSMLVRRYIGGGFVVDVGNSFWRFAKVRAAQLVRLSIGDVIWSAEAGATASYNPRQARDAKGRWSSSGGGFVAAAIADRSFVATHWVGRVAPHVGDRLQALGLPHSAGSVMLESGRARHMDRRHGNDSRGQKPVRASDMLIAHHIVNSGKITHGNPRQSRNGAPRIFVVATIDGSTYGAAFEVGKRKLNLVSMRRR